MVRRRRADFHGAGRFTRYRYPMKFHQPITNDSSTNKMRVTHSCHAGNFLPASLRTTTRYGQEPTVQSTGQRRRVARPPKKKSVQMTDSSCQCSLAMIDTCCQAGSGAIELVNRAVSTGHQTTHDVSAMTSRAEMTNKMTETDVRMVEVPQIDYLTAQLTLNDIDQTNCT